MKTNKIKLTELSVESFVTETDAIKGGRYRLVITVTNGCITTADCNFI